MFYTDDWGSYQRNLESNNHSIGKRNTQTIERKNLTLRTRSQCGYSKSASLLPRKLPAASLLFQWELELPLKQGSSTHRLRGGGLPWEVKRLTRKSIYFSKSQEMHDIVIGLVINILEFGWCVDLWKVHI